MATNQASSVSTEARGIQYIWKVVKINVKKSLGRDSRDVADGKDSIIDK